MKVIKGEAYTEHGQKRLRRGYTPGTCGAAAAKAAAAMLFSGEEIQEVELTVPSGEILLLEIVDISIGKDCVRCAVVKDAGDDPDVTGGMKIYACLQRIPGEEIVIDGGEGVGRVTRPGLDQPVGSAAINSVPRKMIDQAVREERQRFGERCGIKVEISIPGGEETAKQTFNPALGIEGGLSVLGTSGIVEPMSEDALIDTIAVSIRQQLAMGREFLIMAPGNYGLDFLHDQYSLPQDRIVKISNYIGASLDLAVREGAGAVLIAGHIGKMVKVAGGIMNTHSHMGDCRMEILTAHAAVCGGERAVLQGLMNCVTTEAALDLLDQAGLLSSVLESVLKRICLHLQRRTGSAMKTELILFSSKRGKLAQTPGAEQLLRQAAREKETL